MDLKCRQLSKSLKCCSESNPAFCKSGNPVSSFPSQTEEIEWGLRKEDKPLSSLKERLNSRESKGNWVRECRRLELFNKWCHSVPQWRIKSFTKRSARAWTYSNCFRDMIKPVALAVECLKIPKHLKMRLLFARQDCHCGCKVCWRVDLMPSKTWIEHYLNHPTTKESTASVVAHTEHAVWKQKCKPKGTLYVCS